MNRRYAMQIYAIGNRLNNMNNLNFSGEKGNRSNGLQKGAQAVMLATALSAGAGMQSCGKLQDRVHNHYFTIPSDTFKQGELKPIITPPEYIIVEKPGETVHDTIREIVTIPGDTVNIKEDWKSKVPPKQEEMYDALGIEPTGDGKFFIKMSYYDNKNYVLVQRLLNGQASSRDGKVLVYNVIRTKWDDNAENVVLGKNEEYQKMLVYLSEDEELLGMKMLEPKIKFSVDNNDNKSNWSVFKSGALSTPDLWTDKDAIFMTNKGDFVEVDNGFQLKKGRSDQSVTAINPHGAEWELKDWSVIKGDAD